MSIATYPATRDSGILWLGDVPSHWEVRPLKHLISLRSGGTPSKARDDFWEGSVPWASAKDLKSARLSDTADHLTELAIAEGGVELNPTGSILILVRGMMLARAFPVVETLVPMAINQDLKAVNPKPGMTSSFLAWTLRGTARESLDRCSEAGHGTKALRMEDWLTMPFPAPPSEEQVSIAAFLDRETGKIDALIEEQRCLIALLKEKRQAVVSHGVTKGLNPDAPVKGSGIEWLGDIPAHWEARKLTAVARLESGHTPSRQRPEYWVEEDCVIPWFTLADVNQLRSGRFPRISGTTQRISELGMANSAARLLPAGTVILSRTASVGFSGIAEIDLAVSQDFAAWVCEGRLNAAFLLIVLQAMRPEFARLMMGSTHQTIYMPDIEAFKIPLPPEAEQAQIIDHVATALTSIDALTDACEAAIGLLHERRAALIFAAVTGKIDVRQSAKILQFPTGRARARRFVATEIIERLAHQTTFGRTKLQKVAYLAEAHANITELAGRYIRMPYGPLDQPMMDEIEAAGADTGILVDDKHDGSMVRYRPTGKKGEHTADLRKWLGEERFNKLDHLIMALSDLKTHSAEAIATLYAVWNDALIEGKSFTDEQIISAFFGWHPKKGDNFRAGELPHWLDWMRRHGIIPTGSGPKTISQMGALL